MIDDVALQLALRTQLLTLAVCTTGSIDTLSATATGYHRTAGSFLSDGFAKGVEVTPTGFTQTDLGVITDLTAADLTILNGRTAESVGAGRALAVGLPSMRSWENIDFDMITGVPFVEEEYLPGPRSQFTVGPFGRIEALPQYVVKVYAVADSGMTGPRRYASAILNAFPPRLSLTTGAGDVLRVRTNPAPYPGQLLQFEPGWAVIPVTIPLRTETANSL